METRFKGRKNHKLSLAGLGAYCVANVAVLAKALQYARAAQRDERNHFPYTAAMEWRLAAEFFGRTTFAAEYCWRHWEAIMHLPHGLGEAITDSGAGVVPIQTHPVMRRDLQNSAGQISFAAAA
jgi:hypothetical protein